MLLFVVVAVVVALVVVVVVGVVGGVSVVVVAVATTKAATTTTVTTTTTATTSDAKKTVHRKSDTSLLLSPRTFIESVKTRRSSSQGSSPRDPKSSLTTTSLPSVTNTNKGKSVSLPKMRRGNIGNNIRLKIND